MEMQFDENSLLITMNPLILVLAMLLIFVLAFISARKYRDTNDFKSSAKLYLKISIPVIIVFAISGILTLFVLILLELSGMVLTALVSNYYFNHF